MLTAPSLWGDSRTPVLRERKTTQQIVPPFLLGNAFYNREQYRCRSPDSFEGYWVSVALILPSMQTLSRPEPDQSVCHSECFFRLVFRRPSYGANQSETSCLDRNGRCYRQTLVFCSIEDQVSCAGTVGLPSSH